VTGNSSNASLGFPFSGSGGGLNVDIYGGSTVTLERSTISFNQSNTAIFGGGGAFIGFKDHGHLIVSETEFKENHSLSGGGLFIENPDFSLGVVSSALIDKKSSFTQNTATEKGAALYVDMAVDDTVVIKDSNFDSNEVSAGYLNDHGGGALYVNMLGQGSDFLIEDSAITQNKALNGGGVFAKVQSGGGSVASTFMMRRTRVEMNDANDRGGGLFTFASDRTTMSIEQSTISGNSSGVSLPLSSFDVPLPYSGGGIYASRYSYDGASVPPSRLNIGGTTIDNNMAGERGGGIAVRSIRGSTLPLGSEPGSQLGISNSTVSGNTAGQEASTIDSGEGGGVFIAVNSDTNPYEREAITADIRNVTISKNVADVGAGVFSLTSNNPLSRTNVKLKNTIVSGNNKHGISGEASNFLGSINRNQAEFNLISDTTKSNTDDNRFFDHVTHSALLQNITTTSGATPFGPGNRNNNGTNNPGLTPLSDFGGPTRVHEILSGSAAIDRGSNSLAVMPFTSTALEYDQRGEAFIRKLDGDGAGGPNPNVVDIGAVETSKAPKVVRVTIGTNKSVGQPPTPINHPDYQVPDHFTPGPGGTGIGQISTIPVAGPNQVIIHFSNIVTTPAQSHLAIVGLRPTRMSPIYTYSIGNTVTPIFVSGSSTLISGAIWTFDAKDTPTNIKQDFTDQMEIQVKSTLFDISGDSLDGEWTNPMDWDDTSGSKFPSGNNAPGGQFNFKVTVYPGDFNQDNIVDGTDYGIWNSHKFTCLTDNYFTQGDANGDGCVDGTDYGLWNINKFTSMLDIPARGVDTEWMRQQIDFLVRIYGVLENDGVTVNSNASRESWIAFTDAVEAVFAGEGYVDVDVDDDGQTRGDFDEEEWSDRFWSLLADF
jgi:hypothetical protein